MRNNSKECSEEIRKLKVEMDNMKTLVQNPMRECPVCLEIVRLWMLMIQCGMGHILCEDCYKKSREEARGREEGGRDMGRCHICIGEYTGRPAVLEKLLGLID